MPGPEGNLAGAEAAMSSLEDFLNRKFGTGSRRTGAPAKLGIEQLEPRCMLSVNVTTWHNDLTRQGLNTNETVLTPANVNSSTFGKLFSYAVTGQVYAEPLYVSNLNMGALGTHNVVFVATENNDVYAFDAVNNGAGGGQLWHVNLGLAASSASGDFGLRYGPYTDINPQVGITSTPVIDLATNTMYLDSFTDDGGGNYSHHIWSLDITTGAQKTAPKLVTAAVQGNSVDSVGGVITFNAKQQVQRAALTLLNGVVYAAYAGYADTDPYHGWILGFDASNLNLVKVFNTTPNAGGDGHEGEGGIWMAGAGLASDGTHLYVMTGNGDFEAAAGNFGDSFLELTPDNSTQPANKNGYGLSVTDYFTPYNEQTLANNDTDLGSAGPLLLPDQPGSHPHELLGAGKGGIIYLVDRDNFGQYSPTTDNVLQTVATNRAPGSAAYFNGLVYMHGYNSGVLKAFSVTNGALSPAAVASGSAVYSFPGATPAVSSYGDAANGIIWETQYSTTNATLRAYNAVPNGSTLTQLYASPSNTIGGGVKFTVPTVADGRVYVGGSGSLTVFGLLSAPSSAPAAPTGLTATANSVPALQIQLGWTDAANNENAFKIERSDNGSAFVQIAVVSVNATTYTDTNVVSGHAYTYRVRATNPIGDSDYSNTATESLVATPPVYRYAFDDCFGTLTSDSAGANTGVLVGASKPQWVAGRLGSNALSFSGNGAVQVSSDLFTPLGATSTFSAWVKTTQTGNNNHQLAPALTGADQLGTTGDINWGTLNSSGQIGIYVGDSGGIYSTMPINDGQWHNVTMTRNAISGQVQLYVDGTLNATGNFDIGYKAAQFYLIGALTVRNSSGYVVGANYFNGQTDDVQIFDRVLSSGEISALGQPPSAPVGLSASSIPDTGSMLELSWTNRSNTAQTVQVERKTGASGTYVPIATVPGTATSYIDTNLEAGREYSYRLQAAGAAGTSDYSNESSAATLSSQVVGRFIFYNGSNFDFQNGSSSFLDGFALASDKQALLPGETATFQNYTSYAKGINGIMIDVANFEGSITPDDYTIMVGNSSDLSTWQPAPDPTFITQYLGAGVDGSVRLELCWNDFTIQNQWVQVTLKATANTGLATDDVFYFGNSVGDTGNSAIDTIVDAADELAAANNHTSAASITNPYDFNRDKVVDAIDEQIAHDNYSGASSLQLITVPGTPHGAGAGAALEVGPSKSTDVAAPGVGAEAMSVEATVESPANQPLAMHALSFAPFEVITLSNSQAAIQNRAKAVDAVFDGFTRSFNHDDSAARLLNLELNRNARLAGASHSNGQNDLQARSAELCGDCDAADESLTSDFHQFRYGPALESVVRR
jgi:hypothetical protein